MGHDASVVALDEEGEIIFYGQVERYSRIKKHAFDLEWIGDVFPELPPASKEDIVTCVSTHVLHYEWNSPLNISEGFVGNYDQKLVRPYKVNDPENIYQNRIGKNPDFEISHHLAHAFTAWCFRNSDKERLCLCYDGAGLDAMHYVRGCLVGRMGPNGFNQIKDSIPIPSSVPIVGLLGFDSAGKAMGLAGYMPKQDWDEEKMLKLITDYFLSKKFEAQFPYSGCSGTKGLTEEKMQFIADFYRWYTSKIHRAVADNIDRFSNGSGVVIGGGTTLALEINSKIYEQVKGDVVFAPPTDDSGLALGAAAFSYFQHTGKWIKVNTPSLNELQEPLPAIGPQEPEEIAKLIADDKVIGLLRGKSEAGPRALGFRSILASAKKENLKRVSEDIKGREFYRPLAPMVTEEQFDRFFVGPRGEYMQYMVHCTAEAQKLLPAVCHNDNTSRPQVVYKEKDPWLHRLLVAYGKISGCECVINTSLNKKKKPICNTYQDALNDMRGKDIQIISIATEAWSLPRETRMLFV